MKKRILSKVTKEELVFMAELKNDRGDVVDNDDDQEKGVATVDDSERFVLLGEIDVIEPSIVIPCHGDSRAREILDMSLMAMLMWKR